MSKKKIKKLLKKLNKFCDKIGGAIEQDNLRQYILYTGIFIWKDGSFHNEIDPELDC
jgi:hypothetical protein